MEFYFVRHGQTDHNAGIRTDYHVDISLNECGREQAKEIEQIIASLPVKTICYSPMKRAVETKEIITKRLEVTQHEIAELSECSEAVWWEMSSLGAQAHLQATGSARAFIEQVKEGVREALSKEGPVLIVAHGGVHWAMCCLMGIDHEWDIGNCVPVHFSLREDGKWRAKKLLQNSSY